MVRTVWYHFFPKLLAGQAEANSVDPDQTEITAIHQDNMSVCFIPPYTPLLYSKTGVYMGIHFF